MKEENVMRSIKVSVFLFIISLFILPGYFGFTLDQPLSGTVEQPVGKVDFQISCSPDAQRRFNRSMALLHHMMYRQAEKEFKAVAGLDPDCAMAYWGVAMTLFHPLWAPPNEDELRRGSEAVKKAESLNPVTKRERDYVAAVKEFYDDWKNKAHPKRIAAWEKAQKRVHKNYPRDIDAGAFYALSHLATAPKADKNFTHQKESGDLLEKLRVEAPEHPGLFHYTIHAYDNPKFASRAMEVAQEYHKLAPNVPHAQHMPSHIFVRMGMWSNTIEWNTRSAAAAEKQSEEGVLSLHYIHAMDYLMYAYLQRGEDKMAMKVLDTINGVEKYQDSFASAYGIAAAQARYPLELRRWEEAADLSLRTHSTFPWDKYPWHEAITYFARGLGAARRGDTSATRNAVEKLGTLYDLSIKAKENYWAVLVKAQQKTVDAWIAFSIGEKDRGLKIMHEAADLEDSVDKHPVTPGAVLPARELLGDMLMLSGKPNQAIDAYEASLRISPNRYNSLYGAGNAAERAGDLDKAKSYYGSLLQVTMGVESDRPGIMHAKAFLEKN
jgi:tetratricopeptide (TPR) repeat protein